MVARRLPPAGEREDQPLPGTGTTVSSPMRTVLGSMAHLLFRNDSFPGPRYHSVCSHLMTDREAGRPLMPTPLRHHEGERWPSLPNTTCDRTIFQPVVVHSLRNECPALGPEHSPRSGETRVKGRSVPGPCGRRPVRPRTGTDSGTPYRSP